MFTHHSFSSVQFLSCVLLFATPWTAASQASVSITNLWFLCLFYTQLEHLKDLESCTVEVYPTRNQTYNATKATKTAGLCKNWKQISSICPCKYRIFNIQQMQHFKSMLWEQWSPVFWFHGRQFSHRWEWWQMVWGWFKCITFIVHFNSILVTSAPAQITRH